MPDRPLPPDRGRLLRYAARAALLVTALLAAWSVVDPAFEPAHMEVGPDEVAHAAFADLLTLLGLSALPRWRMSAVAALVAGAAALVELAQGTGLVPGSAELRDMAADGVGLAAALLPVALARRTRDAGFGAV